MSNPRSKMSDHPFFPKIKPILESILGGSLDDPVKVDALRGVCQQVCESGGLWTKNDKTPEIKFLNTVMVNFTYPPYGILKTKNIKKPEFIKRLFDVVKQPQFEHHFQVVYDSAMAPMDWSGSIPIRLIHKEDNDTQLFTIQLRKGTIIHSGPNISSMQRGALDLIRVLDLVGTE